jgi:hypothetical protein
VKRVFVLAIAVGIAATVGVREASAVLPPLEMAGPGVLEGDPTEPDRAFQGGPLVGAMGDVAPRASDVHASLRSDGWCGGASDDLLIELLRARVPALLRWATWLAR